jgi:hypothetical protein
MLHRHRHKLRPALGMQDGDVAFTGAQAGGDAGQATLDTAVTAVRQYTAVGKEGSAGEAWEGKEWICM